MKILIVDDDVMLADLLEAELLDQGHEVCGVATNVAEAVNLVRLHRPDIAVLDIALHNHAAKRILTIDLGVTR